MHTFEDTLETVEEHFGCQFGCGFRGTFDKVESHEDSWVCDGVGHGEWSTELELETGPDQGGGLYGLNGLDGLGESAMGGNNSGNNSDDSSYAASSYGGYEAYDSDDSDHGSNGSVSSMGSIGGSTDTRKC
jgi:hypothetical protein